MADIIHLLPDSVANQIAAGEVVQRPSSVVKELLENSIDAGATAVELWLTDAGKTAIQVVDNGKGMSETDARLSFERHATSKIVKADDLFNLRTMGFRGEALASIAAVAQVELRTRTEKDEMGVCVVMEGARCVEQRPVQCAVGANFIIKNLFYNVPARRRFLKSNVTEYNNVLQEFERVALANPQIGFKLYKDDESVFDLRAGSYKQRIVGLFGNSFDKNLLPVSVETDIVRIDGFVSSPQSAKHKGYKQFLFVNGRYMRHPYFNKAVLTAYEKLIPQDKQVSFFLKLEVDPSQIDVNIHPTKTEIKFEEDHAIWQLLLMAVKDSLAKFNVVPSLDFTGFEDAVIPSFGGGNNPFEPTPERNSNYNPFEESGRIPSYHRMKSTQGWESLYSGMERKDSIPELPADGPANGFLDLEQEDSQADAAIANSQSVQQGVCVQYGSRYILTPVKSGLMVIDYVRAHRRILYDSFMDSISKQQCLSQTLLFPTLIELTPGGSAILDSFIDELNAVGFDITSVGGGSYSVSAVPAATIDVDYNAIITNLVEDYDKQGIKKETLYHNLALSVSRSNSMNEGKKLDAKDMSMIIDKLFLCKTPNYGPDGKVIISIISDDIITKGF